MLRPVLSPRVPLAIPGLAVTRRLGADGRLVWTRPDQGLIVTLERIGSASDGYTRQSTQRPDGGPRPGEPAWRHRLRTLWRALRA